MRGSVLRLRVVPALAVVAVTEQPVLDPPRPAEAEPEERERGRRWPLLCGIVVVLAIGSTAALQFLGPEDALIAGACVAGAGVLGVVAWRLPQLRKHFGLGRGRSGRRWSSGLGRKSFSSKRAGGAGFRLPKLGGRGGGTGKGRGKGLPKLGGRARAAGKGLAGRGKALGRALAGKARSAGRSAAGKGKSLGRALTGKGRGGARGKGLPKLGGRAAGAKAGLRRLLGGKAGGGKGLRLPGSGGKRAAGGKTSGLLRRAGRKLRSPFSKTGSGGKSGTGKTGMLRRAGRRLRHPLTGKAAGKTAGKGTRAGSTGKRQGIARALRAIGRGTRSAYRRGRKAAGSQPGQSRWRKIGTAAAAVPFVPFIAAWAAWKKARAWWHKRRQPPEPDCRCPLTGRANCPVHGAQPGPEPPQEPPERHPGPPVEPGENGTPTRRNPMSIDAVTEALDANVGGFEPENVADLQAFLSGLPRMYETQAAALTRLAERFCDELPIDSGVGDSLRELAARAAGDGDLAGDLIRLFGTRHEEDLNRLDNPRPGEEFMDYGNQ